MKKANILFCSCGRRATLLKDFHKSMNGCGKIVATELSPVAPALFMADNNQWQVEAKNNIKRYIQQLEQETFGEIKYPVIA